MKHLVNNLVGKIMSEEYSLYVFERDDELITIKEYDVFMEEGQLSYSEFKPFTMGEFYELDVHKKDDDWIVIPDDFLFLSTDFRDKRTIDSKVYNVVEGKEVINKIIEEKIDIINILNDNIVESLKHFINSNRIRGYYICR